MTSTRTDEFAAALQDLERTGDTAAMAARFADDAELVRAELPGSRAEHADAAEFWQRYLGPFRSVRSEFSRVDEQGDLGVLEWRSAGELADGSPIDYRGVSLLTFGDGGIQRFATYFDTAAFLRNGEAPAATT